MGQVQLTVKGYFRLGYIKVPRIVEAFDSRNLLPSTALDPIILLRKGVSTNLSEYQYQTTQSFTDPGRKEDETPKHSGKKIQTKLVKLIQF